MYVIIKLQKRKREKHEQDEFKSERKRGTNHLTDKSVDSRQNQEDFHISFNIKRDNHKKKQRREQEKLQYNQYTWVREVKKRMEEQTTEYRLKDCGGIDHWKAQFR